MDLDPRLAAHAASFWGWSDDEAVNPQSDANSDSDHGPARAHDGRSLVSKNHTIDDMRSDDDDEAEDLDQASSDEDEDEDEDDPGFPVTRTVSAAALAANRRPVAPQVVVFDDPTSKDKSAAASYGDFKSFMSSKVSKVTAAPPPPPPMTDAERQEELELSRQDRELDDLLKTSKLIEQVAAEELTGRDRRKYQLYKLEELGMAKVKSKMPLPEYLHISDRDKKREARALKFATDAGLDVGSVKRGMTTATALARNVMDKKASSFDKVISFAEFGKKKEGKRGGDGKKREKGLKGTNLGKFKDGMLVLSKQDIRKVQGGGVSKSKKAGGGGGGGRGGSIGGKMKGKRK